MEKVNIGTKMQSVTKTPISDLNDYITCKLCKGYFIDATTIIECLHTFCRSCIVQYLKTNKYCPICDVQVNKTKPLHSIRPDKTIQNIVYKLVPRLHHNEIKRKEIFYKNHPETKPTNWEHNSTLEYDYILTPEENVYITLRYYGSNEKLRYLRCPSAVTISHICKLIIAKYDLTTRNKIDIFYDQDCLNPSMSLMDVSYIYSWKRTDPLDLTYKIYELRAKKREYNEIAPNNLSHNNNNNNNWKEVHLKISESGEMSVTGIQDSSNLLDSSEKSDRDESLGKEIMKENDDKEKLITNEQTKNNDGINNENPLNSIETEKSHSPVKPAMKKDLPALKYIGKTFNKTNNENDKEKATGEIVNLPEPGTTSVATNKPVKNLPNFGSDISLVTTSAAVTSTLALPKSVEISTTTLNLGRNNELSLIPLNSTAPCTTTTVFTTIDKRMCSTKQNDENKLKNNQEKPIKSIDCDNNNKKLEILNVKIENIKEIKNLKRKNPDMPELPPPTKLPKPTILNHSISWSNLPATVKKSINRANRNGEQHPPLKTSENSENVIMNHHIPHQKSILSQDNKPIILNRNFNLNRPGTPIGTSKSLPCYAPKPPSILTHANSPGNGGKGGNNNLKNGLEKCDGIKNKMEFSNQLNVSRSSSLPTNPPSSSSHYQSNFYQNAHYRPIITPSQLPHNMNSLHHHHHANIKQSLSTTSSTNPEKSTDINESIHSSSPTIITNSLTNNCTLLPITTITTSIVTPSAFTKPKSNAPIGYKTLRDPPKSWNSQIAKANHQCTKIAAAHQQQQQQLIGATSASAQGRSSQQLGADLKNVRPPKFFKGRNMPRYLGNPASGVKPMYQLHTNTSPEKDKNNQSKVEKSEIKKHSIVKIDPKTLRPVSEKAPDISNLSNISNSGSNLGADLCRSTVTTAEMKLNPTINDLKINTSSVSIFSPLKLQSSPKGERKSPKSPHSPKLKSNSNNISVTSPVATTSSTTLSPKQHRDKTNLTYTPPNPFVPNLASPTLNPSQFFMPPRFPSPYDPRFVVAYQSYYLRQQQQMAAAIAASSPTIGSPFNINMGPPSSTGIGQYNNLISLSHCLSASETTSAPLLSVGKSADLTTHTITSQSSSKQQLFSTAGTKKPKDSPTNKSEKSLIIALEKLSQNKAKELDKNRQLSDDNKRQRSSSKSPKNAVVVSPKQRQIEIPCENKVEKSETDQNMSEEIPVKEDKSTNDEKKLLENLPNNIEVEKSKLENTLPSSIEATVDSMQITNIVIKEVTQNEEKVTPLKNIPAPLPVEASLDSQLTSEIENEPLKPNSNNNYEEKPLPTDVIASKTELTVDENRPTEPVIVNNVKDVDKNSCETLIIDKNGDTSDTTITDKKDSDTMLPSQNDDDSEKAKIDTAPPPLPKINKDNTENEQRSDSAGTTTTEVVDGKNQNGNGEATLEKPTLEKVDKREDEPEKKLV